jgi:hypothetical protein
MLEADEAPAEAPSGQTSTGHAALTDCSASEPAVATVEHLAGSREQYTIRSSTTDASARVRRYDGCPDAGAGPERTHRLDLSHLSGPFRLYAVLDAEFEPVLALGSGECSDMTERLCSRDPFGRSEARFAEELEPGVYIVVVDGAREEDHGAYTLQIVAEPLDAACSVPANTTCASALPLALQGTTAYAFLPKTCESHSDHERFFALDLLGQSALRGIRARTEAVDYRVGTQVDSAFTGFQLWLLNESGECSPDGPLTTGGLETLDSLALSAAIGPERYALELVRPPSRASYMRVELQQPDCSGEVHDTCSAAEDVVLRDERATIHGETYCNSDTLSLADCGMFDSAPDRLYRLDLRDRPERVRIRATIPPRGLDFYATLALLHEEDGACGAMLECFDSMGSGDGWARVDATVEPGVYLLAVKGVTPGAAGRFTLEVDVSDWQTKHFSACYGGDVDNCLRDWNHGSDSCCENPLGEACGTMFVSCGLAPSVQDCVCQSDPVCCAGEIGDAERCAPVFAACNYFCPDAAGSAVCVGGSELFSRVEMN